MGANSRGEAMTYQPEALPHKGQMPGTGPSLAGMTVPQGKIRITLSAPIRGNAAMRALLAVMFGALLLAACSKPTPPVGRWEGTYESDGTFIAARLELAPHAQVRISAPDVTDPSITNEPDRAAMRQNMADRLAGAWGEVEARPMDFDGTTFRKPNGFAPQIEWNSASNMMTLYVYLGARPALHIPLNPVSEFSADPWPH